MRSDERNDKPGVDYRFSGGWERARPMRRSRPACRSATRTIPARRSVLSCRRRQYRECAATSGVESMTVRASLLEDWNALPSLPRGYYVSPTVSPDMTIAREEIFGPRTDLATQRFLPSR